MKRLYKYLDESAVKEEFRKLGNNLITASAVGGFVTHVADLTRTALILLVWLAIMGIGFIVLGLRKRKE